MLNARTLIEQRTGLDVASQLRLDPDEVLREMAGDVQSYQQLLTRLAVNDELAPVWQKVIRTFAIGETYFFRDQPQFHVLRHQILPALIAERRAAGSLYLNIWSVGCATGEEPYSLAILLHELLRDAGDAEAEKWTLRLVGTDLNAEALEAARRAVYRPWSFRNEARSDERAPTYERYFDTVEGGLQLKPVIREMVTFRQMNLLKGPPLPQLDIILCRHVLLYFSDVRAAQVESMLFSALRPGGWLFMGRAEALHHRSAQESPGWAMHLFPKAPAYQRPLNSVDAPPVSGLSSASTRAAITETQPAVIVGSSLFGDLTERPTTTATAAAPMVDMPDSTREVKNVVVSARLSGDAASAERLLKARLMISPDSALSHLLLASLCADQKRLGEAHTHLDRALSLDVMLADAHTLRGLLYLEESRHEDARTALQSALYCQRNHPLAAYTLGTLMAQLRDFSRALKLWEIARSAVAGLPSERPLSDLSDMTVGQLQMLVAAQIAAWK